MKKIKRLTALVLCLCLLTGLPLSVQAVESSTPTTFDLVSTMVLTETNRVSKADVGTLAILYFNGQSSHGYANLNSWYDIKIEVLKGDVQMAMSAAAFAASNNYWHNSSAPSAMQSVRCPVVKFADANETFASYLEKGATAFKLYITEKNSNNNGKLDSWKSFAGLSLTAPRTYEGKDAVICDIVTPDQYLTIKQAVKTSDTTVAVQFSEPVALGALYDGANDGTLSVTLEAGDVINTATAYAADANDGVWVTFTFPQISDGQTVTLKIAEVTDNLDALRGQANFNALVDSVINTAGSKLLLADGRTAADTASIAVELSPLQLTGAQLHGDTHVLLSFSKAVQLPENQVDISLGFYKDNQLNTEAGSWPVDVTTVSYYGASGDTWMLKVSSVSTSIQSVAAELGDGYTLGLTVTSRTADNDGRVNEIKSQDGTSSLLATVKGEKDSVYAAVESKDAFLELVDVEAYKEDTLLLRFNAPVVYDAKRGFLGLSLLNPADMNRFFYYSEQAPHTLYTYAEYTADPTGKKLCQWNLNWVGYYRNDQATLEVRVANNWTMSQILDICEGSGGKLYLRIQENADHDPNSGTVGVVRQQNHGWDELDYQLLATNRGKQDQVRFEVADCRNEVVVESAELVADDTVKITFNKPVSNRMYNPDNGGSTLLRLAKLHENGKWVGQSIFDGTEAEFVQWAGKLTNYDPNNAPDALPDAAAQVKEWYFRWSDSATDTTIRDLLAMTEDPDSVYADYELMLVLERNYKLADGTNLPISPNSVDNFTSDADGDGNIDYILIQNNYNDGVTKYGSPGHYAPITADDLPALITVESVTVLEEQTATVVFSEAVASMKNVKAVIRVLDARGNTVQAMDATLTPDGDGKSYTATVVPTYGAAIRNFSAAWQLAKSEGGSLVLGITQTGANSLRDGMVNGVRGVGGGKLLSTVCSAAEADTYYKEITSDDFSFDPEPFAVEQVTQLGSHTLLVEFTDDIKLVDKDSMYVALRMIDPAKNNAVVKVGSRYMQWQSQSVEFADDRRDALLVTFPDTVDIGVLVSKVNMDESFIPYEVVFLMEESPTLSQVTKANHLVHHIRRAADEKQLESTFKTNGTTSCDAFYSDVELIDPTADIAVDKVEVVDQSRIVVTFSEEVVIDSPEAYIRLVDKDYNTMTDQDGNRVMWGGQVSYYNDAHTQIAFALYGPGVSHVNLIVDGLDQLFAAGYETDGWNLMLAIGDRGSDKVLNGLIDSIVSTTGKILLADAFTGIIDQVFLDIDASQIPQGELTLDKIEIVSDLEAVVTFSAPVEVGPDPFSAIRLFDQKGRLLWKTADGKYTVASKNAEGEANTPIQWSMKWAYANEEQNKVALTVNSMIMDMGSYNDILSYDWEDEVLANCDEDITGVSIVIGFEELNSKDQTVVLNRNNRVENIRLKGNEGVALTATKIGSYDGCFITPVVNYTPQNLTASARIVNEMQIRVSFSAPVTFTGNPFMALRYVDADNRYQIMNFGEAPNLIYGQWSGSWAWENESQTSLIWTLNGKNSFGVNNLSDIINDRWSMSALPDGGTLMFCIEELNTADVITVGGKNMLIDNVTTRDGKNHLRANRAAGYDSLNMALNLSSLTNADGVEILSAKAIDDQTIELTFSEGVLIEDGEKAAKMNLYYRSISGDIEVLANGKNAVFKGTWEYKDEHKNVILWKLDSPNADSLTDIYNYTGNLRWNVGADVVFMIENDETIRPSRTERMWGITSLDGYRLLKAPYSTAPFIEVDVEIAYDVPEVETETDAQPQVRIEYVTNYLPYIVGGGAAVLAMAIVTAVVLTRKKKEESK